MDLILIINKTNFYTSYKIKLQLKRIIYKLRVCITHICVKCFINIYVKLWELFYYHFNINSFLYHIIKTIMYKSMIGNGAGFPNTFFCNKINFVIF